MELSGNLQAMTSHYARLQFRFEQVLENNMNTNFYVLC